MDFQFSEEQVLMRDTVARFLSDNLPFDKRQNIIDTFPGYAETHWQTLAELGVLALPFDEDAGGLGGGSVDAMLIMEQMGRALLNGPFVPSIILCGGLLERLGNAQQKTTYLDPLMAGAMKLSFAYAERGGRYDLNDIACTANPVDGGFVLSGTKIAVFHADTAQHLIVSARTSGERYDEDGISLFVVPCDVKGISIKAYATQDGNRAADVTFDNVVVERNAMLGDTGIAFLVIEDVLDHASAALCAEATGIMWSIYDMTLEYLKTRKQFGATLGSFQALQHRMVDMYMMCEMAQSMAYEAAQAFEGDDRVVRRRAVSAAKSLIGRYGRKVGQEGIQLHGGIGMTLEYAIGHYFKRLCMIDMCFGDAAWHQARYAATLK